MNQNELAGQDSLISIITEFGIRLNELEEKQRLLRDRTILIGENLITFKDESLKDQSSLKNQITGIENEIKDLRNITRRIINELKNLSRRSEFDILERQFKMFQPLEFARVKDIRDIVRKEISELNNQKNSEDQAPSHDQEQNHTKKTENILS